MTIAELKELKPGTKLYRNMRDGSKQELTFIRAGVVISYGNVTLQQLITGDLPERREMLEAVCEYERYGRTTQGYFKPWQLHRREERKA